jgi:hypothetical protein
MSILSNELRDPNNSNYFNYLNSYNDKGNQYLRNNKFSTYYNTNEQIASSFNAQYNYFATWCLSPNARMEFNTILNHQPIYNVNYNKYGYDGDESYNKGLDKNLF